MINTVLAMLSIMVGGWVSKDLFVTSAESKTDKRTFRKIIVLIILSLAICLIKQCFCIYYGTLEHGNPSWYYLVYCLLFLVFAIFCFYNALIFLLNGNIYFAIKWLLPLTEIIVILSFGANYGSKIDYLIACKGFYFKESYYLEMVSNAKDNQDGSPKLVVFHDFGGDCDELGCLLLVYDESDDLANDQSIHKRFFENIWTNSKQVLPDGTKAQLEIYQTNSKKIKDHFYFVSINFGKPIREILYN